MRHALPAIGLLLLAFGGYITGVEAVSGFIPFNLILVGAGLTALSCAAVVLFGKISSRPILPLLALALAMAPGVIAATRYTVYGEMKVNQLATLVPLAVVGAALLLQSEKRRAAFVAVVALYSALIAGLTLAFPSEEYLGANQWFAEGSNYIAASRSALAGMIVLAMAALYGRRYRLLAGAGAVGFFGVALLTGARGPLIAAAAAFAIVLIARSRTRSLLAIATGAVPLYLAYLWLNSQGVISDRLANLDDTSTEARQNLASVTLSTIGESPLGIGWGELSHVFDASGQVAPGVYTYPHNIYLEMFAEGGWIAGIVFLAVLLIAFRRQVKAPSGLVENSILALFLFFAFSASVSGDLLSEKGVWVLLGACLCAPLSISTKDEDPKPKAATAGPSLASGRW